jgi:hypothetical protein
MSSSVFANVFSYEDVHYLNNLPEVRAAKDSLDARSSGMVKFTIVPTDELRTTLEARFGLRLSAGASIPMRWIKGDTAPHVDVGASKFDNTYLVFLNDSPGELIVDSQTYPIEANTGFVFSEGLRHETQHTGSLPRLLLGPMNELAEPVGGGPGVYYFSTKAAAIAANTGAAEYLGDGGNSGPPDFTPLYTVGSLGGYTSWRIASSSEGLSPQNVVYTNGSGLDPSANSISSNFAFYYLYPAAPCFLEGSTILCQVDGADKYVPVEQLKKGTLVKTSLNGYKPVVLIGKGQINNPGNTERTENRLYKCSPSKYPELTKDLFITGCHSILAYPITDKQKEDTIKHLGRLFVTEKKYRLMACVDERAEPWNSKGTYTIWHFALENSSDVMNYGVYANGGLLVETCCIKTLKNKSNMTLY